MGEDCGAGEGLRSPSAFLVSAAAFVKVKNASRTTVCSIVHKVK